MNSMSFISTLGTPNNQPPYRRTRSASESSISKENPSVSSDQQSFKRRGSSPTAEALVIATPDNTAGEVGAAYHQAASAMLDEKTPLLQQTDNDEDSSRPETITRTSFPRRFGSNISAAFRYIISTLLAPGRYVIACFYDDEGHFSAALPFYRLGRKFSRRQRKQTTSHASTNETSANQRKKQSTKKSSKTSTATSTTSDRAPVFTDSDLESEKTLVQEEDSPALHTRSKESTDANNNDSKDPSRRIRIKVSESDPRPNRKITDSSAQPSLSVSNIKSPTSPTSSLRLTKYPRAPAPPRPLVPRRQPSYTSLQPQSINPNLKTLIIDLDETLIHSMAKGGRMSTGHMVEVKLQTPVGAGGAVIGPQVPILYYVHKRPHCDEFLRKISKWYNLIVFTASVQEYADPVIDWLELERKYFSARYYRQHCTYRNGAYIKDLSQVEPDLSRVMILDNSPISYIFHEDNAIPIEGWISDPTDNDLLHLIPLFEGLQYTTDVRALLALRLGEATNG